MTANDELKNNQDEEINNDPYWKTYFEDETVSMDAYRERIRLACEHGNKQKQSTTQRLDKFEEKQKSKKTESIFDR